MKPTKQKPHAPAEASAKESPASKSSEEDHKKLNEELKIELLMLKKQVKAVEQENEHLKKRITNLNPDDVKAVKKQKSDLEAHAAHLERQLRAVIKERKKPFDQPALQERISQLEETVAQYVEKERLAAEELRVRLEQNDKEELAEKQAKDGSKAKAQSKPENDAEAVPDPTPAGPPPSKKPKPQAK